MGRTKLGKTGIWFLRAQWQGNIKARSWTSGIYPGAADIRDTTEGDKAETITAMSKAEKVLAYIRQNGSISMQKVMETCNYSSRTGARKLIDKMINADFIEKTGEGNKTIYKIKE